jgi:hypothetical protein
MWAAKWRGNPKNPTVLAGVAITLTGLAATGTRGEAYRTMVKALGGSVETSSEDDGEDHTTIRRPSLSDLRSRVCTRSGARDSAWLRTRLPATGCQRVRPQPRAKPRHSVKAPSDRF